MNKQNQLVDAFLIRLVKDTKSSLQKKEIEKSSRYGRKSNMNSRLWGTIRAQRKAKGENTAYQMLMADYYQWVDGSRNPGNVAESADIEGWVKRKNTNPVKIISEMRERAADEKNIKRRKKPYKKPSFGSAVKQFAFLVRRKVQNKGYKGNKFYSSVLNDGRVDKLRKDYAIAAKEDIIIEVKEEIK